MSRGRFQSRRTAAGRSFTERHGQTRIQDGQRCFAGEISRLLRTLSDIIILFVPQPSRRTGTSFTQKRKLPHCGAVTWGIYKWRMTMRIFLVKGITGLLLGLLVV